MLIVTSQGFAQTSSSGDLGGGAVFDNESNGGSARTDYNYNHAFIKSIEEQLWDDVAGFSDGDNSVAPFLSKMYVWEEFTRENLKQFSSAELEVLWHTLEKWNTMIGWTEQLKAGMLADAKYNQEDVEDDVKRIMDDTIAQALATTNSVTKVVNALEGADLSEDRNFAIRGTTRSAAQPVRAFIPATSRVAYAGGFSDVSLQGTFSYADIDDDLAGDGYDMESGMSVSGWLNDKIELGLSVTHTHYDLDGPTDLERNTDTVDVYATWCITDRFSVGAFVNHSHTDIEDSLIVDPLLGPIQLADTYSRWGAGVSTTLSTEAVGFDWGVTTSIASTDNRALDDVFDHNNCAWVTLFDMQKSWSDSLSTMFYATYYTTVTDVTPHDTSFWMVGGELSYALTDTVSIGFGYEKTLGLDDFSDHRFSAIAIFYF
jgi:hypothetical protein